MRSSSRTSLKRGGTANEEEQDSIDRSMVLLIERGPALRRPHVGTLAGSRFANMKELRVQHHGRPYRILFAFDPRRVALLLLGGDKTGEKPLDRRGHRAG